MMQIVSEIVDHLKLQLVCDSDRLLLKTLVTLIQDGYEPRQAKTGIGEALVTNTTGPLNFTISENLAASGSAVCTSVFVPEEREVGTGAVADCAPTISEVDPLDPETGADNNPALSPEQTAPNSPPKHKGGLW